MIQPDQFDAFYKRTRARLLLQTYALTGDLPAARSAVRDSFVRTWHHWRKVSRMTDQEAWVRPHAWSQAHRRHTARIWHRDKHLDAGVRDTLAALGKLSFSQRKSLVLAQLTDLSSVERARELGVPRAEADRQLQTATNRFLGLREVTAAQVPVLFEDLAGPVAEVSWPRASIIRRSGAARRRTHTLIGAAATVAAVLVSGTAVSSTPALDPGPDDDSQATTSSADDAPPVPSTFDADHLLTAASFTDALGDRRWRQKRTSDNSRGDGLATPCQQERYADADGVAGLVRTFSTAPGSRGPRESAVQVSELSADPTSSRQAWRTTTEWYAGCTAPQVQLLHTHRVRRVGDQAMLFELQQWGRPTSTYVVGVARTGRVTTTTFTRTTAATDRAVAQGSRLLGKAVDGLCSAPGGGTCPRSDPSTQEIAPLEVGEVPGLLSTVDLPPVTGLDKPWVGTEPRQAKENAAATRCDRADFSRKPMSNAVTRTFLVPEARLPAAFGLTETAGTLPPGRARGFVQTVRDRMRTCSDRDPGSDVTQVVSASGKDRDLAIWRVTSELSDDQTVTYLMGVARVGGAVGQVGFVPGRGATLPPGAFDALLRRASARLAYLPRAKG